MYEFKLIETSERYRNNQFDTMLFTSKKWIDFLIETTRGKPIFIEIYDLDLKHIGYFTGIIIKKLGIKILGSPFKGWSTPYMGFDISKTQLTAELINQTIDFIFKTVKVHYIEISEYKLIYNSEKLIASRKIIYRKCNTLILDVTPEEDILFVNFKSDVRNFVRQFEKRGAYVQIVDPNEEFAERYYDQLKDVFKKQNLVPTYNEAKVKSLMRNLKGNIICAEVCSPDGKSIASVIILFYNKFAYYWGGASYKEYQKYRPNEALQWYIIKLLHKNFFENYDMIGVRPYKMKYKPDSYTYTTIICAKSRFLIFLRDMASKMFYKSRKLLIFSKGKKNEN